MPGRPRTPKTNLEHGGSVYRQYSVHDTCNLINSRLVNQFNSIVAPDGASLFLQFTPIKSDGYLSTSGACIGLIGNEETLFTVRLLGD